MSSVVLKSKCGNKKPRPMDFYLSGTEIYKRCRVEPGWDKNMALLNAYKHEFTNYNKVTMDDIYHRDIDWEESVKAMADVYREFYMLVPKKYHDVCKKQYACCINSIKRQLRKYENLTI